MPVLQERKTGYVQDVRYAGFAGAKKPVMYRTYGMPVLQEQKPVTLLSHKNAFLEVPDSQSS